MLKKMMKTSEDDEVQEDHEINAGISDKITVL